MRVKNILKSHKGFTLVELVVVIAILCILATMAFLKFDDNLQAAKGAKLIAGSCQDFCALSIFTTWYKFS